MAEIAVLIFLTVFFAGMAVVSRLGRDRLQEEISRHIKLPLSETIKARDILSKAWRVSEYTPLHYEQAFSLGLFSGFGALLLVPVLFRSISPPTDLVAVVLGALVFWGAPYLVNDIMRDGRVKDFRGNIEFGLETLVSVLLGSGGDLPAAVKEVARVSPGVVAREFVLVDAEITSHKPLKDAFAAMALRVPCQESRDISDAAELYETVGGASALDLFRDLSETVQEGGYNRSKVQRKFKTLKFYGWLVGIIPVPLLVFLFLQHSWSTFLVQTNEGRNVVVFAVLMYLIAFGLLYLAFQFEDL